MPGQARITTASSRAEALPVAVSSMRSRKKLTGFAETTLFSSSWQASAFAASSRGLTTAGDGAALIGSGSGSGTDGEAVSTGAGAASTGAGAALATAGATTAPF